MRRHSIDTISISVEVICGIHLEVGEANLFDETVVFELGIEIDELEEITHGWERALANMISVCVFITWLEHRRIMYRYRTLLRKKRLNLF